MSKVGESSEDYSSLYYGCWKWRWTINLHVRTVKWCGCEGSWLKLMKWVG